MAMNQEQAVHAVPSPSGESSVVLFGSAKPPKKENFLVRIAKEQNPIAHAEQLMHIVDNRIVPKLAPMDQQIARDLRPGIEAAALLTGTALTAAQVAIPVIAGARLIRAGEGYFSPRKATRERIRKVIKAPDTRSGVRQYISLRQIAGLPEAHAGDFESEAKRADRRFAKAVAGRDRIGVRTDTGEWRDIAVSPKKLGELTDMFRRVIRVRPSDAALRDFDISITGIWGANGEIPGAYDRNALAMDMITQWTGTLSKPVHPNDLALLSWLWESTGFIGLPRENWQDMRAFSNRFPMSDAEFQRMQQIGKKTREGMKKHGKTETWGVPTDNAPLEYPHNPEMDEMERIARQGGFVPRNRWVYTPGGIDMENISIVDMKKVAETRRKEREQERTLRRANRLGKGDWAHPAIAAGISVARDRAGDASVAAYDVARLFDRVPEILKDEKKSVYIRKLLGRLQLLQEFDEPSAARGVARQLFEGLNRTHAVFLPGEALWQAADYWLDTLHMASLSDLLPKGLAAGERRDFLERTFARSEPDKLARMIVRKISSVSEADENTPVLVVAAAKRIRQNNGTPVDMNNPPREIMDLVSKGYRLLLDTRSEEERRIFDKIRAQHGVVYEHGLYDGETQSLKRLSHHIMMHRPEEILKPLIRDPKFSEKRVTSRENRKLGKFVRKLRKYMKQAGVTERYEQEELRKRADERAASRAKMGGDGSPRLRETPRQAAKRLEKADNLLTLQHRAQIVREHPEIVAEKKRKRDQQKAWDAETKRMRAKREKEATDEQEKRRAEGLTRARLVREKRAEDEKRAGAFAEELGNAIGDDYRNRRRLVTMAARLDPKLAEENPILVAALSGRVEVLPTNERGGTRELARILVNVAKNPDPYRTYLARIAAIQDPNSPDALKLTSEFLEKAYNARKGVKNVDAAYTTKFSTLASLWLHRLGLAGFEFLT